MPRYAAVPGVWLRPDSPLTAGERYVLMLMALHSSRDDHECYPSQQQVADEGKISRKTVNEAVQGLIGHGALTLIGRMQHNTAKYRVEGFDVNQREGLPWTTRNLSPTVTTTCNPLVTGKEIGSTTYEASSNPELHKQYLTMEQGKAVASRERQINHNPPSQMPEDVVSPDKIKQLGESWRAKVGPLTAPKEGPPPTIPRDQPTLKQGAA
jgi:hypothetical protein